MPIMDETFYTLDEVAEHFKVSRRTVNRWVEDGKLSAVKFAPGQGHIRVADTDLKEFIQRHRTVADKG